jgi:replicative DNA helicase
MAKKVTESFTQKLEKIRKNAPEVYPEFLELGKMPPQAIAIEEAILGALMLERDSLANVVEILKDEMFYKDEHKTIYSTIIDLYNKSKPIDILTLTNELRQNGELEHVGGAYYLTELTNRVASSANIEIYARILVEKYIFRELIRISAEIQEDAYNDTTDVFDLLDKSEQRLFEISQGTLKSNFTSMSALISTTLTNIEKIKLNPDKSQQRTIFSGFQTLDEATSGWQPSDFVILASRPGMGKTALALSMARNIAVEFDKTVALFSLEMTAEQLVIRLLSAESGLDSKKLRNGDLEDHEWQQLHSKISKLSKASILIDDTAALSVFDLRARCRRIKSHYENLGVIIVDYLQLMTSHTDNNKKNFNREQEISSISRALKSLAKEIGVPVIALSQLSRDVEKRTTSKRPVLSDLRESGSIEQDADQVLFIYRPEYYGLTQDESGNSTKGIAEVILAKNRHGSIGNVGLRFIGDQARFADPTDFDFEETSNGFITRTSKINGDDDNDDRADLLKADKANLQPPPY